MEITDLSLKTKYELILRLRKVTMLKDDKCFVYRNSYITIETLDPNCLSPCQFYVLKDELNKKIELQEAFSDIFNLNYYYEFKTSNEIETRTLLPPIVEESIEKNGKIYSLINDGMHRIYLALLQKRKISVVYIRGASKPYYAEINSDLIKKIHRIQDNKKLYRNFDSVFTNCSKPRGLTASE